MDDNDSHVSDGPILERWERKVEESSARGTWMFMGTCPEVQAHTCGSRRRRVLQKLEVT